MRAIIYSRVSTDAQERDGTSLETQERACLELAQRSNWLVVDEIRDTASGFTLDRPGIARLRQLLRQGAVDVVIAYAVDRLSRNQNHIGVLFDEIEQAGARLEFVTEKFEDTAIGRFILAARAFIGEVEREKIAERTMRGKLERARSGRIPQAMGRGTYGYTYNQATGHREIEPFQAATVRRMFERYAETRSFSKVSNELNDNGIPSLEGCRWYPLTIRNMLVNESYAGRLFWGQTKWVPTRNPKTGQRRRRPVDCPRDEWTEIEGASPRIVDETLWSRVQEIIADRQRSPRQPAMRVYPLRGRIKCGVCGSSMVGQTMTSKGQSYRYYGCRHIYDRRTGHDCTGRYVRADRLEAALWAEVKRVLTDPTLVLQELEQASAADDDAAGVEKLKAEIASLRDREKRMVKLFSFGEVDETYVRDEIATLRQQRTVLEGQLISLRRPSVLRPAILDKALLETACAAVAEWLDCAGEQDQQLALEALQIAVVATRESATVAGVLPETTPEFFTLQCASA
jgi:site-specific DNA recombinase